jgi:hypothetical protein
MMVELLGYRGHSDGMTVVVYRSAIMPKGESIAVEFASVGILQAL